MKKNRKKIYLAKPRGFCSGVISAVEAVEKALKKYGRPVYILREIVHNKTVVSELAEKGAYSVQTVNSVPEGRPLIFSAHGVSLRTQKEAEKRNLTVIDATCSLVKQIHQKAVSLESQGYRIILIGHKNHPEIIGTAGRLKNAYIVENESDILMLPHELKKLKTAYLTQTTFSIHDTEKIAEKLKAEFPQIYESGNICYATEKRQKAVIELAEKCDSFIVVGSKNSSNSNRLKETAEKYGVPAYLTENYRTLPSESYDKARNIGITAGASAPERLVMQIVNFLKNIKN